MCTFGGFLKLVLGHVGLCRSFPPPPPPPPRGGIRFSKRLSVPDGLFRLVCMKKAGCELISL